MSVATPSTENSTSSTSRFRTPTESTAIPGAGEEVIPGIVFACDTEPVLVMRSPHDWVTLRPLDLRLKDLSLAWNISSS